MSDNKRKISYNDLETDAILNKEDSPSSSAKDHVKQPSIPEQEEHEMITFEPVLFTDSQMTELLSNGLPQNSGKNHIPVAYFEIKQLGYSILATEISHENHDLGFGLCDYNTELKFCSFSIEKLYHQLQSEHAIFSTNLDFLGKYPIGVYAKVAKEVGTIVTDDKDRLLKPLFNNFSNDVWANQSARIDDLKPLF